MRERLVELIADARNEYYDYSDELHEKGMSVPESSEEYIADYLIANGAVVPPCKVGDVIYETDGIRIYESIIRKVIYETKGIAFDESAIGKSVFLSRDDAERALKGGK